MRRGALGAPPRRGRAFALLGFSTAPSISASGLPYGLQNVRTTAPGSLRIHD
jgi:hypothetical protein